MDLTHTVQAGKFPQAHVSFLRILGSEPHILTVKKNLPWKSHPSIAPRIISLRFVDSPGLQCWLHISAKGWALGTLWSLHFRYLAECLAHRRCLINVCLSISHESHLYSASFPNEIKRQGTGCLQNSEPSTHLGKAPLWSKFKPLSQCFLERVR